MPRKNVLRNNIVGCTMYSALDLVDGFYQLLMQASDIPLTAVSTQAVCYVSGWKCHKGFLTPRQHLNV